MACFHKNSEGDESAYFLKHGKHSKHKRVPFFALVDFMPVPNPNKEPSTFDKKVKTGLMVGYHCHPGGEWSGDYYVAEFDAFRINPDAEPKDVTIHRTAELIIPPSGYVPYFPLYEYREQQRRIHDLSFEEQQNLPAGTNHVDVVDRRPDAESAEAVLPDTRGQRGFTKEGRYIRPYKGSTRPPHVDPVVWEGIYIAKDETEH